MVVQQLKRWFPFGGRGNRAARRPRALAAELLESREVPATFTWSPTAPGEYLWNDPANWGGAGVPNAADDVANLTAALTGNQTIELALPITVGTLNLGSTGTSGTFTIVADGGSLTFDGSSGNASLTDANNGGDSINAPILLNNDLHLWSAGTAPLALGGTISGNAVVTTSGTILQTGAVVIGPNVMLGGTGTFAPTPLLYAGSYYDGALYEFNAKNGSVLATLVAPNSGGLLQGPAGMTLGPNGNLYIASQWADSILEYDLTTQTISTFISPATLGAIAAGQGATSFSPAGLLFGPDGNLYVSLNAGFADGSGGTFHGAEIRFDIVNNAGTLSYAGTNTAIATALAQPNGIVFGIAAGDTDTLYVSNAALGQVVKITGATGAAPATTDFVASGSGGLEFPSGLAWGPDNKFYVVDLGASDGDGKVLRYGSDGSLDSVVVAPGDGAASGDLAGQFPSGILFDDLGNIVVSKLGPHGPTTGNPNDFSGSINVYGSSGAFSQVLVSSNQFPETGPSSPGHPYSGIVPSPIVLNSAAHMAVSGTVNPGGSHSAGIIHTGDLDFAAGGALNLNLAGAAPGAGYGQLISSGTVDLNGAALSVTATFTPTLGSSFTIVSGNLLTGTFSGLADGDTFTAGTQDFQIRYTTASVILTAVAAPHITSTDNATFHTGTNNSFNVTATGFPTPTFSETGALPGGVSFSPSGVLSGTPSQTGSFPITITATNAIDVDTQSFTLHVDAGVAPSMTSVNHAEFGAGTGGAFTVVATGTPTVILSESGALPTGVSFDPATGILTVGANTPQGVYGSITFKAGNGVSPDATQPFTLTVGTAPIITSAASQTFYTNLANSFSVQATGFPAPTFSETGALPNGVALSSAGLLSGTPTQTGTFPIAITATNQFGSNPQSFSLRVAAGVAPTITSADHAGFVQGTSNAFSVTSTGTPTPSLTATTSLPTGVTFTPNGANGTLSIASTTAAGAYHITFQSSNGVQPGAAQDLILTIGTPPTITSANSKSFVPGVGGAFTITATGSPKSTLAETATLPTGVTFSSTTGVLTVDASTPVGIYTLNFTAANGVGSDASQTFTLKVVNLVATEHGLAVGGTRDGKALVYSPNSSGQFGPTGNPIQFPGVTGVDVRATQADVNGDGVLDTVLVTGPGKPIRLTVINGQNGTVLVTPFDPFGGNFTGGGFVSAADFDGDGHAEIIVTPDRGGGPRVTIFSLTSGLTQKANYFTLDSTFRGGIRTATGDINGDGVPDLAVAAGFLGGPRIAIIDGKKAMTTDGFNSADRLINDFFAFEDTLRNGSYVAIGDVDGDGFGDLIFGAGPGGAPRVLTVSGKSLLDNGAEAAMASPLSNFFVAGNASDRGGVRVAAVDADGDAKADVVVGSGEGQPSRVRIYLGEKFGGAEPASFEDVDPFATTLADGVFVG